jgi:annexin A7/11
MQSLVNDLESDLNGSFQTLAVMLTHGMAKFLSIELHETMSRSGTDETSLTEIVMSRSNAELAEVRNFFLDCEYNFCIFIKRRGLFNS